jgi:DNA-3-methyladenine glycosylase
MPAVMNHQRPKLSRKFYARKAEIVARELVGAVLVRRVGGVWRAGRITETEAYVGAHDLACHAAKGRTRRTEIMFGPAGYAYVYLIYGMYCMLNIVTGELDDPQAVLIRGARPLDGWRADLTGPGKLAGAFAVTLKDRGLDMTGDDLFVVRASRRRPRIVTTPRIGIDYAGPWKHAPLRFLQDGKVSP